MHRNYIGIALHQITVVMLYDGRFREIDTIQDLAFVVNIAFGRV